MDTMTILELLTGATLLPLGFIADYLFGSELDE
jgi:hypothetical protein